MNDVLHSEPAVAHVNGIEVVYDTFGDTAAVPMLLIMGLGNQMISWREDFCAQLAARGFWVIRFDNRDAGLSTKFDGAGKPKMLPLVWAFIRGRPLQVPYTLQDMADDAVGLLDVLHISSAHVVGVSLGGMIAQMMAIHHSGRTRTMTSMLSTTTDPRLPKPRPKALILFRSPKGGRDAYIEHGIKVRRAFRGGGFPFDEAAVREHVGRLYDRSHYRAGAARQIAAVLASGSRTEQLSSVAVPTLVIHGAADPLVPVQHGVATAQAIPGAELLVIEGLGHELPPQAWPQVIEAIVRHAKL